MKQLGSKLISIGEFREKMKHIKKLLVIALIVGILLVVSLYKKVPKEDSNIVVHYYRDGKEIFPNRFFSLVNPPGLSFNQLSFDIIGENIGALKVTNMKIENANPIEFKNSFPTLSQTLEPSERKKLWSSNLIDTIPLESYPQPVLFIINVNGTIQQTGQIVRASYNLSIRIEKECYQVNGISITLGGNFKKECIEVINNGIIYVDSSIGYLNMTADRITVDSSSKIIGTARSNFIGGSGGSGGPGTGTQDSPCNPGAKGLGSGGGGGGGGHNCYGGGAGGGGAGGEVTGTEF